MRSGRTLGKKKANAKNGNSNGSKLDGLRLSAARRNNVQRTP